MAKLSPKQARFVKEYLIDLNATQAAKRAGYSEKTAEVIGHQLLKKTLVQEAISAAQKRRAERSEITAQQVLNELALIAFSDITDYADIEVTPSIKIPGAYEKSITIRNTADIPKDKIRAISSVKEGQCGVEIKLCDKIKALELIGRHLAMFTDKKEVELGAETRKTMETAALPFAKKLKLLSEMTDETDDNTG